MINCTTVHYTTPLHTTQNYTTLTTTTATTTLLLYTTLHYTRLQNTTVPCIASHYTHYTTTHATATTPHQVHDTTTTTPLHYSCITPHYIQHVWWGANCNHCNNSKNTQLQPPFGPSVDSAILDSQQPTSPIGFLIFLFSKLPPPPCAVLVIVYHCLSIL